MSSKTSDDPSDEQLVRRALSGDQEAYTLLWRRHCDRTYRFFYYLVRDPGVAEDLSQEAFEKAFKKLNRLQNQASFKSWLQEIVRNCARDYYRRKNKEKIIIPIDDVDKESDEYHLDERVIVAQMIEEVMSQLHHQERECLILHTKGLESKKIAEILKLTEGTVNTYVSGARKKLRKSLRDNREEDQCNGGK